MDKYDKDGPFNDPIVRCASCQKIILRETIRDAGMCPVCGNRRVTNVLLLSEEEMANLKTRNIDPDFLELFEGRDIDGV